MSIIPMLLMSIVHDASRLSVTMSYAVCLLVVSVYGLYRYILVVRFYLTRAKSGSYRGPPTDTPAVTVQLPMYNEANVAERVIDAACSLRYPSEKLHIQVLDDSTDHGAHIARQRVEYWKSRGSDIEYIHRSDRIGYKAGALQNGLASAKGDLITVFDADFIPPTEYLYAVCGQFADAEIGMVQASWDHLNRNDTILTRCQAVFLDSHFQIEHPARHRAGHWFNFNGTAGTWRKAAIIDAGGWQHDTLTEDMDLSYRAQLARWRFVYLPTLLCPAELPPTVEAFKTQQRRWVQGTVQTAQKLLREILRSPAPLGTRLDAVMHLTTPIVYPCVVAIALLMLPTILLNAAPYERGTVVGLIIGGTLLVLAMASGATFYVAGQRQRGEPMMRTLLRLPILLSVGVGMTMNNTLACVEGLRRTETPFVRTPKFGQSRTHSPRRRSPDHRRHALQAMVEIAAGIYLTVCLAVAMLHQSAAWSTPLIGLFAVGYLYIGICTLSHSDARLMEPRRFIRRRPSSTPEPGKPAS